MTITAKTAVLRGQALDVAAPEASRRSRLAQRRRREVAILLLFGVVEAVWVFMLVELVRSIA
jgi:hypothetical protein